MIAINLTLLLFTAFIDTAYFSYWSINNDVPIMFIIFLNILTLVIVAIYLFRLYKTTIKLDFKVTIKNNFYIVIPVVFFTLKLININYVQFWDGSDYLAALLRSIDTFDFTISEFLNSFNWYGHPAMGYSIIVSLGQFIDKGNEQLLNLTNTFLAIVAIIAFYKIIQYMSYNNIIDSFLLTAIFAFNPLLFAGSTLLNTDFPLLVYLTCTIYAIFYNHRSLIVFFGTLLVFSKEPGILLYTSLVIPYIINTLYYKRISIRNSYHYAVPIILLLLYYVTVHGRMWRGGTEVFSWDNSGYNCFGINKQIIVTRLFEIFVLNFSWISLVTIIIATYFIIKNKSICIVRLTTTNAVSLILVFTSFTALSIFFIGPVTPRYIIVYIFFTVIFYYLSFKTITSKKMPFVIISSIYIVLSILQTFKTADPVSIYLFGTYNIGSNRILKIGFPGEYGGTRSVYNNQFTVINNLYNNFNRAIQINKNTNIFVSYDDPDNCFDGSYGYSNIFISSKSLNRTHSPINSFQPNIYPIRQHMSSLPQEAYYIHTPWSVVNWNSDHDEILEYLQSFYNIESTDEIKYGEYSMKYYKLHLKSIYP